MDATIPTAPQSKVMKEDRGREDQALANPCPFPISFCCRTLLRLQRELFPDPTGSPRRSKAFLAFSYWADGICILTYCESSHPGNGAPISNSRMKVSPVPSKIRR